MILYSEGPVVVPRTCMMKTMMGFLGSYVDGLDPWRTPAWPGARGLPILTTGDCEGVRSTDQDHRKSQWQAMEGRRSSKLKIGRRLKEEG